MCPSGRVQFLLHVHTLSFLLLFFFCRATSVVRRFRCLMATGHVAVLHMRDSENDGHGGCAAPLVLAQRRARARLEAGFTQFRLTPGGAELSVRSPV